MFGSTVQEKQPDFWYLLKSLLLAVVSWPNEGFSSVALDLSVVRGENPQVELN